MKKLLLITLIIPFISIAQEEKQSICFGDSLDFSNNNTIRNCKEGDIFVDEYKPYFNIMLRICKEGTISMSGNRLESNCILRAENDFLPQIRTQKLREEDPRNKK